MSRKKPLTTIRSIEEIPTFHSEAEEHAFWATHELSDALWDQAEPLGPDELPPPRATSIPVVILLDEVTLRRVKALARRRGESYQSLLEEFVTSGVAELERQTG